MKFEFLLPRNTKNVDLNLVINSNDRFHFHKKAWITSQLKSLAHYEAITFNGIPFSEKNPCQVHVTVYSPTKSKLDPPNLYPTVKALVDGLTVAGILKSSTHFTARCASSTIQKIKFDCIYLFNYFFICQ